MPENTNDTRHESPWGPLLNPIVLVVFLIVLSVILLIGAAVLGIDKGVLRNMSRSDFARGLVTYLFAIVTIGTAVVMVLSGLLGADDGATEKRFQRGKEILSLLLGVFGTIVGFYFGAEAAAPGRSAAGDIHISAIRIEPLPGDAGGRRRLRAVVNGGTPPYVYAIEIDGTPVATNQSVAEDGWIIAEIPPAPATPSESATRLSVADDAGEHAERTINPHQQ